MSINYIRQKADENAESRNIPDIDLDELVHMAPDYILVGVLANSDDYSEEVLAAASQEIKRRNAKGIIVH